MKVLPSLHRITNLKTGEHFTVMAKDAKHVIKLVPVPFPATPDIPVKIEQVLATETSSGIMYPMYRLKDLPTGTYFKSVNIFGFKAKGPVLVKQKGAYDRSTKKYDCILFNDICAYRSLLPSHLVIIDFTF